MLCPLDKSCAKLCTHCTCILGMGRCTGHWQCAAWTTFLSCFVCQGVKGRWFLSGLVCRCVGEVTRTTVVLCWCQWYRLSWENMHRFLLLGESPYDLGKMTRGRGPYFPMLQFNSPINFVSAIYTPFIVVLATADTVHPLCTAPDTVHPLCTSPLPIITHSVPSLCHWSLLCLSASPHENRCCTTTSLSGPSRCLIKW